MKEIKRERNIMGEKLFKEKEFKIVTFLDALKRLNTDFLQFFMCIMREHKTALEIISNKNGFEYIFTCDDCFITSSGGFKKMNNKELMEFRR